MRFRCTRCQQETVYNKYLVSGERHVVRHHQATYVAGIVSSGRAETIITSAVSLGSVRDSHLDTLSGLRTDIAATWRLGREPGLVEDDVSRPLVEVHAHHQMSQVVGRVGRLRPNSYDRSESTDRPARSASSWLLIPRRCRASRSCVFQSGMAQASSPTRGSAARTNRKVIRCISLRDGLGEEGAGSIAPAPSRIAPPTPRHRSANRQAAAGRARRLIRVQPRACPRRIVLVNASMCTFCTQRLRLGVSHRAMNTNGGTKGDRASGPASGRPTTPPLRLNVGRRLFSAFSVCLIKQARRWLFLGGRWQRPDGEHRAQAA
jgi:hypothetical protein